MFDPPGQVSEAHWNEEAKALISGLLLHLACRGTRANAACPNSAAGSLCRPTTGRRCCGHAG
ncbi:hypothetical protein ACFQU7_43635 [Pseudoroseomonas wenyumeiae]